LKTLDPSLQAFRDLSSGRYLIRTMTPAELREVTIPWMRTSGWNPGIHDASTFLTADPDGFLIGMLDGRPIACVSAVRYDDSFGFFGCYLVDAPFRGFGYGLALHEAGRRHLAGCTQGGDGVLENVEKYRRIGREFAYRNARHEGIRTDAQAVTSSSIRPAQEVPWEAIVSLDRSCFPARRTSFLKAWINQPDAHALVVPGGGDAEPVLGFGVIRRCFSGWKIGPLFARNPDTAELLFTSLVSRIPVGDSFYLDVPEPNPAALALVSRHGMREVFATARMYTGPSPVIRLDWVYGVTTFELG